MKGKSLSRVRLLATPWTAAYQAPPSMGFSRQEYWSGVPSPSPIGYPFQCSWASLVAQMVTNPPAMAESWVQSLDWEDPQKEGMAIRSSILAWRIPMDSRDWQATINGVGKSWT